MNTIFEDCGKALYRNNKVSHVPEGYQKITWHLGFDVKHNGRHRARLVADGDLSGPVEAIYSGIVSLRSLRIVVSLAACNSLEIWGADIGNAYHEAYTDEKRCIVAGPEFKELQQNFHHNNGFILIANGPK